MVVARSLYAISLAWALLLSEAGSGRDYCDRDITSELSPNGTVTSPEYPNPYPRGSECRYRFYGKGKERVQLMFKDLQLGRNGGDDDECIESDVIIPYILVNGESVELEKYCGESKPEMLMSNGPEMTVIFKGHKSGDVRGFKFIYRFLDNFGITSGRQDPRFTCAFIYNSSETRFGWVSSPNHPGYYPRNIECHYFFYGQRHERVRLVFTYFNVEGIFPCLAATDSDYVEFSNFQSVDRKMPRFCGYKTPDIMTSDSDFFHITFMSNQVFDATGFLASYQFINNTKVYDEEPGAPGGSQSNGAESSGALAHLPSPSPLILPLLLLLVSLNTFSSSPHHTYTSCATRWKTRRHPTSHTKPLSPPHRTLPQMEDCR